MAEFEIFYNNIRIMQAEVLGQTNCTRDTPLHCILHLYPDIKLTDIMPLLERSSLRINKANCDGNTALHVAVFHASVKLEVVNEFLNRGADANLSNNNWNTPLHIAVSQHLRMDVIQTLLKHMDRRSVDQPNKLEKTPLGIAVRECSLDVVKELIRFGADVHRRNYMGENLLHSVKIRDDPDIIKLLLDVGVSVEATDRLGNTPLHIAALQGHEHTVELLLKNGASANARNNEKKTPLHCMRWRSPSSPTIVNLLVEFGADCCAQDIWQRMPMYYACNSCLGSRNAIDSIKVLILHTLLKTRGLDVDIKEDIENIINSHAQEQLTTYKRACQRELVLMQWVILCKGISLYDVIVRKLEINEVVPNQDQDLYPISRSILRELCSNKYPTYHNVMLDHIQKEWLVKFAMELEVYTVINKTTPGCKTFRASLNRDAVEMILTHLTKHDLLQFIPAFSTLY